LLSSLPEDKFSEDPWLALASAWGLAYEGDLDQAQMLLKLAATGSEDPDGENRPRLKGRILVLQAYLAGSGADYPQSVQFAREALKELPESDLSIRSFTILIIGNAYRFEGKLKDALHYHQEALQLSERARDTSLSVIILSRLVEIYRITGQVELSCGKGRETLALIEQHQYKIGVTTFIEGYLKLRLSRSYYERNELEQAYQSAETGLELAKQWGAYDSLSLGYFNFCEIYQAMGDAEKAGSYLQEFMQKFPFESRFQYRTALAYQAELALRIGDVQSAEHWAQSSGLQVSDNIPFLLYKFYDVLAQVLIAQKKYADARPLMEKLLRTAVESGAVELEIQARGRMALMLMEAGDEKSALEMFTPALNLAAAGKYMRTILDLGDEIAQGILIAAKKGIQVAYCSDLLENIQPAKTAGCAERQVLIEPLSSRENDVLGLIALGYSNQEIAEELTLSLYTIKSHARNIFSKLGVKNRTEAVARARRLGVLPQE
jgi:LuxR family maltose regulon positive regulatory protein